MIYYLFFLRKGYNILMNYLSTKKLSCLRCVVLLTCFSACHSFAWATDYYLDHMKANKILFLGNSITRHPAYQGWGSDTDPWGMAATTKSQDYVHVLANRIDGVTGGSLRIDAVGTGDPNGANVLNIADILERVPYVTSNLQQQINAKPDIVVVQLGENQNITDAQLKTNLQNLLADLKKSSNPNIFVTSNILGHSLKENTALDIIKKDVCAEDSTHRVFVDMGGIELGLFGHPSDAGMTAIATTLYAAMEDHAARIPEPGSMTMVSIAGSCLGGFAWHRWRDAHRTSRVAKMLRQKIR